MNPQLVNVAISIAPAVIELLKSLFKRANPSAPVPTDDEVIAAYQAALDSSLAKDAQWLSQHPEP